MAKLTKKQSKAYLLPAASYASGGAFVLDQYRRNGNSHAQFLGVIGLVVSGACLVVYSTRKTNLFVDFMVPKWLYGIKK